MGGGSDGQRILRNICAERAPSGYAGVSPGNLFDVLRSEFPKRCRMFAVRKGELAIAGVLCFYFRIRFCLIMAGALPEFYKDSPNNFMYWSLIAQSCTEGFRLFDFGRSKRERVVPLQIGLVDGGYRAAIPISIGAGQGSSPS